MNKVAMLVFLLAFGPAVVAAPTGNEEITCEQYFELGKKIMEGRQAGVAMPDMMKIAGENTLFRALVITAYEKSRYSTEKYKNREIGDFANDVYMACLKRGGG